MITQLQKKFETYVHLEAQGNLVAIKPSYSLSGKYGGGTRGSVTTFSAHSRRRMLRKLARIAPKRVVFVTLTYPERYPDPAQAKNHLRAFFERIRRRFPQSSGIWRMEFQERGAPHFHILFCELPFIPFSELRRWWSEIIHDFVDGHLPRVRIEKIKSRRGAFYYCAKYCAKMDTPGVVPLSLSSTHICTVGRFWGVFNRNHLPYAEQLYAIVEIMFEDGFKQCKAAMREVAPEQYPSDSRGRVIFAADSLNFFRRMLNLLKPDMRPDFRTRFTRWTHENHTIQPTQDLSSAHQTNLRTGRLILHAANRLRGRSIKRCI